MIILPDQNKVSGVKITPRNIFILDQQIQDAIIANLKTFYNMIDYEFWLIVADKPVDISGYLAQLEVLYQNTSDPARRKIINDDLEKANLFMNNSVVDTEYYLLFKEKNPDVISKRIRSLIDGFRNSGLTANQTSNDDLRTILDNFLNGGQTTGFGVVMA